MMRSTGNSHHEEGYEHIKVCRFAQAGCGFGYGNTRGDGKGQGYSHQAHPAENMYCTRLIINDNPLSLVCQKELLT